MTALPFFAALGSFCTSAAVGIRASVTQTLPSLSTWMPCGHTNMPPPKLLISLPFSSKWWTGLTLVPRQPGVVPGPHRSVAHTVLPSLSTATPFEPPHGRFSLLICAQSRMTLYGLAPLFTAATPRFCGVPDGPPICAWLTPAAIAKTAANTNPYFARPELDIAASLPADFARPKLAHPSGWPEYPRDAH